jgi:parallel beta-helix repeat protein
MKSLDQLEARIIVNFNNTPGDALSVFKITNSGSYYLTGNMTGVSGKHGIIIAAPNVTLDLNGFSLIGVPGSLDGISATNSPPLAPGLVVRNGSISTWGGNGINAQSGGGAPGAHFSRLLLLTNGLSGLRAVGAVVTDCVAEGNVAGGNTTYGIIAFNSRIVNCVAKTNLNGIQASAGCVLEGCVASDNSFGILADNSTVLHCTCYNNSSGGMYLFSHNRIVGNLVDGNGKGSGITVAAGSVNNLLDENTVLNNSATGITLGNTGASNNFVIRNTARANGTSYNMGTGNSYGPIVNVNGLGDISTTNTASHPWANFSY